MERHPAPVREMSYARLMTISIMTRLMTDSSVQMFNPYLPLFAAGLGATVVVMGRLVSARSAMGLFAPLFGAYADRHGYRPVMRAGLFTTALGLAVTGFSPTPMVALAGMVLMGLGSAAFVPTLQAYLSARLPYHQRARGIGMLEYSWALTGIVGLSLIGLLIAATSWRAPFFILAVGIFVMGWVFGALPGARHDGTTHTAPAPRSTALGRRARVAAFFDLGENAASAYSLIASSTATFFAAMLIMIVYGAWLAGEYGLGPRQLGSVALVFGCFDLTASVSVSLFTDRFGKRRSVLLGTAGALAGYLLIPWFNVGLIPAVLATALSRGFFEFAVVSNIPLMSEQVPAMRGKVLTLGSAASLGASTLAAFIAPALYASTGIGGVAALSALFAALALLLVWARVQDAGP
ncbi:MAG: MFS transporter [Caldilineaceae bacterium]|nr:MFS transporter [Caldilineaceae bacterium]